MLELEFQVLRSPPGPAPFSPCEPEQIASSLWDERLTLVFKKNDIIGNFKAAYENYKELRTGNCFINSKALC